MILSWISAEEEAFHIVSFFAGTRSVLSECDERKTCAGECCVVLATGGDDQSLRVMQIRVRWPTATSKPRLSVLAHAHLPNAHSSALKVQTYH